MEEVNIGNLEINGGKGESHTTGSIAQQCMLNSDLCRNIASYCDGTSLALLERVNSHWRDIAAIQFRCMLEYREYKFLTIKSRNSLPIAKRAICRIENRRNKKENLMYLFGGAYQSSSKTMCSVVDSNKSLDLETVTVTEKIGQDLPRTLSCSACTSDHDGNILILGGWDDLSMSTVASVRCFDTQGSAADRKWRSLPSLCRPRCFGAAIALSNGSLLHIGGGSSLYVGGVCYADTFVRKSSSSQWDEGLVPNLKNARYGHSALELFNGNVVITGGYGGGTLFHRSVEMLSSTLDRWTPLPDMHVPRSAMAAVVGPCGSIYVAGGTLDGTIGHKAHERFDPREGKWTRLTDMHVRRGCTTGCLSVCNNGFYVFGGMSNWEYNPNMELYDFRMDQWTLLQAKVNETALLGRAITHLMLDL